jgi:alpha-galactosidase
MIFVVWFEPERVDPNSRIAREHPEFVLRGGPPNWTQQNDGLFNLADPQARRYLTDLLSRAIEEHGIDVYRNDFNIDPLAFWRAADEPERQGMTEIRYIEGLYEMWDELRARHRGLLIDNCASGGRRIDLETTARSLPLWRSDTQCTPAAQPLHDQVQTSGLTRWIPLHSAGAWEFDPYHFWSVAQAGVVIAPMVTEAGFPTEAVRARICELRQWRELWLGEFWPLTPVTTSEKDWCAWQLHLPEHGRGMVMAFRRAEAPEAAAFRLRGIEEGATYVVRDELTGQAEEVQGTAISEMQVEADTRPGVRIISYWRL